jgi:uncharacterized protein (TIGR02145 family)
MRTQLNKIILAAGIMLAITFTLSCSKGDDDDNNNGDNSNGSNGSCDIKDYKTKKIDDQTWMAENLNCNVSGSKCYNDSTSYCNKYGRLYDWEMAMRACPSGWHLPSDEEWKQLINYVENDKGCANCAGKYLKATSGWNWSNGEDSYSFSALPGGLNYSSDYFAGVGDQGRWWSSSENNSNNNYAYVRHMHYGNTSTFHDAYSKSDLYSVRCVMN